MPSSLTVVLPSALVCSTRPRVSVCGTGATRMCLAGFLGSMITGAIAFPRGGGRTLALRLARRTYLPRSAPLRFNPLFRQGAAVSLLRRRVAARCSNGILTVSSVRLRLDGCGLASPGNPWPCGGGASHPPCRYLYLHLLFHALQRGSRRAFDARGMLPYRCNNASRGFGSGFHTRLLSTPGASTSELLRTL